jgi:hypothetical protein
VVAAPARPKFAHRADGATQALADFFKRAILAVAELDQLGKRFFGAGAGIDDPVGNPRRRLGMILGGIHSSIPQGAKTGCLGRKNLSKVYTTAAAAK